MNKINSLLILLLTLLTITSCHIDDDNGFFNCIRGEGNVVTQEITVPDFTGVKLEIAADVYITQGDDYSVIVTGQQNIIDELERDVQNGRWEIEFDGCVKNYSELTIFIEMPLVDYLSISGSGTIYGENTLYVDEIDLKISGSGDIIFDLNAYKIDAKVSGSGKMKLSGEAEIANYKISGSGDYHNFQLETLVTEVNISGSGNAEVFVEDYLEVDITGSGDVYYKGYPTLDVRITGSGNVIDAN